jgi:hypothetical protein
MKACVGVDVWIHIFFTSVLVRGEWSASSPGTAPGTHWVGDWAGLSRSGRRGEEKILDTK